MTRKIAIPLGIVLVGLTALVGFIATRPSQFHIERSAAINTSPDAVMFHIADFHRWAAWSPWEKMDLNMKKTFSGPSDGVGAMYAWAGNDKVGKGKMTITEYVPAHHIGILLEFMEPWKATNQASFDMRIEGSGTKVTWSMDGQNDFVGKACSLFMDMDAMVGKDFEKGLASLKRVVENDGK